MLRGGLQSALGDRLDVLQHYVSQNMESDMAQYLKSVLGGLGLLEQPASQVAGSVPTANGSGFMAVRQDGAAAALSAPHGAVEVSDGDITDVGSQAAPVRAATSQAKEDTTCPCCLGGFWQPVRAPCGHPFCRECICDWLENSADKTCPMCRAELSEWRPGPDDVDHDLGQATQAAFASDVTAELQSVLVELGLLEHSASQFVDSVPTINESELMTARQDSAGAALSAQHGAVEVSDGDGRVPVASRARRLAASRRTDPHRRTHARTYPSLACPSLG